MRLESYLMGFDGYFLCFYTYHVLSQASNGAKQGSKVLIGIKCMGFDFYEWGFDWYQACFDGYQVCFVEYAMRFDSY